MQCPSGDSELISHTTQGENGLAITYSTCPACRGHWMSSFAANFIKIPDEKNTRPQRLSASDGGQGICPICQKNLERATGENIPDGVMVLQCPDHHGYFFPTGQLASFKEAQTSKIAYHKLWHIPLPGVASVLLAGIFMVVLTGGIIATYTALQTKQATSLQARQLLVSHHAYVVGETKSVLLSAQTSADAALRVRVSPDTTDMDMKTDDHRLHTVVVSGVTPGKHAYRFTITVGEGQILSEPYSFTMPQ